MSDAATAAAEGTPADAGENASEDKGGKPEYTPPASQAELDRIVAERLKREREKYADYPELQKKAKQLDEITEAQKTEAEKAAEERAKLERENAELKVANLRAEVAEAKSDPAKGLVIPASLLTGSTREEIEASADQLIKFRGEKPQRADVPAEGGAPALPLNGDGLEAALKKKLGVK